MGKDGVYLEDHDQDQLSLHHDDMMYQVRKIFRLKPAEKYLSLKYLQAGGHSPHYTQKKFKESSRFERLRSVQHSDDIYQNGSYLGNEYSRIIPELTLIRDVYGHI